MIHSIFTLTQRESSGTLPPGISEVPLKSTPNCTISPVRILNGLLSLPGSPNRIAFKKVPDCDFVSRK